MASRTLAPVLAQRLGKGKKVGYLVPDYTFGHTQFESMARLTEPLGWKTVSKQVCPVGTADYSTYLLNIANSGADVFVNCTVGNDCSTSIQQARTFGVTKNAALVVPTLQPVAGTSSNRWEFTDTLSLTLLSEDTWIVVMVKGTDGVSEPLFPVVPNSLKSCLNPPTCTMLINQTLAELIDGNLGQDGMLALAFTNPLFVDVDGGGYTAPGLNVIP